jgi:serine/threonine protein kinase
LLVSGHRKDPLAFSWSERYKVAVGVAEALEYLHSGCAQPVIHRDVKSSNILLSDDFEPQVMHILYLIFVELLFSLFILNFGCSCFLSGVFQLCDFGLAKWAPTSSSHITCTDVAGTFGFVTTTPIVLVSMSYLQSCHSKKKTQ